MLAFVAFIRVLLFYKFGSNAIASVISVRCLFPGIGSALVSASAGNCHSIPCNKLHRQAVVHRNIFPWHFSRVSRAFFAPWSLHYKKWRHHPCNTSNFSAFHHKPTTNPPHQHFLQLALSESWGLGFLCRNFNKTCTSGKCGHPSTVVLGVILSTGFWRFSLFLPCRCPCPVQHVNDVSPGSSLLVSLYFQISRLSASLVAFPYHQWCSPCHKCLGCGDTEPALCLYDLGCGFHLLAGLVEEWNTPGNHITRWNLFLLSFHKVRIKCRLL